jgi:hypothetical protein
MYEVTADKEQRYVGGRDPTQKYSSTSEQGLVPCEMKQ